MMSKDWDKERDAMSEAWYLPESKQEPVAVVGSVFSLLWINRGHFGVSVGDFLYTSPPKREPLSDAEVLKIAIKIAGDVGIEHDPTDFEGTGVFELARAIEKYHGIGVEK
jgi:hypothetical protein